MRDFEADLKKINYYKNLLDGFNLSGLTRAESLEIVTLAEKLVESNKTILTYYDKYQKSVGANKKLNRKHSNLSVKYKELKERLKEFEGIEITN